MMVNKQFVSVAIHLSLGIIAFLMLAIFVRTFIVSAGVVDGLSMFPTYKDDELLMINKISLIARDPKRGDIVQLIHKPNKQLLVKRIIGLPGETIRVRKNSVYLINEDGSEEKIYEPYLRQGTLTRTKDGKPATFGPFAPHEYFVMGDNREHSSADSRLLGPIPRQWIYGIALPLVPF